MAIAVMLGAFGEHLLKNYLSEYQLSVWAKASFYHFINTLSLFALVDKVSGKGPVLIALGAVIFSLSLYAIGLTGMRAIGMITPVGGILIITGWVVTSLQFKKN